MHGRALQHGNESAATCNDCHGTHDILPVSDPHSKIWKQNVASTCGRCHAGVYNTYAQSIHGQAVAKGVLQAATCTDCHSEHKILAPGDPGSPVFMANVSQEACSRCHADTTLMAGFAMPQDRVPTYEDSYHGLAAREGRQTVANCASCHGVHNIYPSSDPRSTVNHANLSKTCGQCHNDAGSRFAIGPVHAMSRTTPGGRILDFVRIFYFIVIPVTIGFMLLHNFLDLRRKARAVLARYRQSPRANPPYAQRALAACAAGGQFHRAGHHRVCAQVPALLLGRAFGSLGTWLADPRLGSPHRGRRPDRRLGLPHRLSADEEERPPLAQRHAPRRARREGSHPDRRDTISAVASSSPRYRRFNYAEKAEYWALVWGTAVMAVTGVVLWFNDWILAHLPHPAVRSCHQHGNPLL